MCQLYRRTLVPYCERLESDCLVCSVKVRLLRDAVDAAYSKVGTSNGQVQRLQQNTARTSCLSKRKAYALAAQLTELANHYSRPELASRDCKHAEFVSTFGN